MELAGERMLVDAKYKTRAGQERGRVLAADVYEGLAFLRASGSKRLALVYPGPAQGTRQRVGTTERFETISVDDMEIRAFHVEVRGISVKDGFRRFGGSSAQP